MSDDDMTERARRIVSGAMFGLTTPMMVDAIVSDLAAAGLLATPEHDAAVAARAWDEGCAAGLREANDKARGAQKDRDEAERRAAKAEAERDEFNGFWKDALADVRKARDERDGAVKRYGALWADVKNAPFDTIFTKKLQGGILARADERGKQA